MVGEVTRWVQVLAANLPSEQDSDSSLYCVLVSAEAIASFKPLKVT